MTEATNVQNKADEESGSSSEGRVLVTVLLSSVTEGLGQAMKNVWLTQCWKIIQTSIGWVYKEKREVIHLGTRYIT